MIRSYNRFNFGKHYGRSVIDVARTNPGYIYYCENELGMRFSPRVKRECSYTSMCRRRIRQPAFY